MDLYENPPVSIGDLLDRIDELDDSSMLALIHSFLAILYTKDDSMRRYDLHRVGYFGSLITTYNRLFDEDEFEYILNLDFEDDLFMQSFVDFLNKCKQDGWPDPLPQDALSIYSFNTI